MRMAEEEIVFQLLEEDRKARVERIVEEKKITTEDCLVLGILRLQKEIGGLRGEIGGLHGEIDGLHSEIGGLRREINGLRGEVDGLSGEIGRLHSEVDELRGEIRRLDTRTDEMNKRIESYFRWTAGMIFRDVGEHSCYPHTYSFKCDIKWGTFGWKWRYQILRGENSKR